MSLATSAPKPSFAAILAAERAASSALPAARAVRHAPAAVEEMDDDLRLALALSAAEAEAATGSSKPSSAASTLSADTDIAASTDGSARGSVDEDAALALALQEEELRAERAAATAFHPHGGGSKVRLTSQLELAVTAAKAASGSAAAKERRLYSADDAEELAAALAAGRAAGPGAVHANPVDARMAAADAAEAEDDELLRQLRARGGAAPSGANGSMLSKHDRDIAARVTARRLERDLGPSASGDLAGELGGVAPSAVVSLRRHMQKQSVKGMSARGRVEASATATRSAVWDARTEDILRKLVNSGRLGQVGGVLKVGKESAVHLGLRWDEATHRQLAGDGWAAQRAQVWDDGDEEDDDEEEEDDEAEEGEEEEDEAEVGDEAEAAAVPSSSASASAAAGAGGESASAVTGTTSVADTDETGTAATDAEADGLVAVKIFKTSLADFRDRRKYMEGDRRFVHTKLSGQSSRRIVNLWAEREFQNLIRVHRAGIPSPRPLLLRGHVIVMSFLGAPAGGDGAASGGDGTASDAGGAGPPVWPAPQLRELTMSLKAWAGAYLQTLQIIAALFKWAHLVHGDLSPWNLLWRDGRVHVIDFGQAMDASHPRALELLRNDIDNVSAFFARQGVPVLPVDDALAIVTDARIARNPPSDYGIRTGSAAGSIPAAGSGLKVAQRAAVEEATAEDLRRGVVPPVASATAACLLAAGGDGASSAAAASAKLGSAAAATAAPRSRRTAAKAADDSDGDDDDDEADDDDAYGDGDPFDGESGPVVQAVLSRMRKMGMF